MKTAVTTSAVALLLAILVHAQGALTGKWQGETRNGSEIVLELTATDATLTGTLTRNGEASPISDSKVSKNTFTFKATRGGQTESVTGEVSRDQMKLWLDRNPQSTAVLAQINK